MAINKLFLLSALSLTACLDRSEPVEADPASTELSNADEAADARASHKTVFVTRDTFQGKALGGVTGADAICQAAAAAADLRGTYKAWISDVDTSARDRVTHARVPYKLVNGPRIAANFDDLLDGGLAHEIDRDERGDAVLSGTDFSPGGVWTGSRPDGTAFPWDPSNPNPTENPRLDCERWSSELTGVGILGNLNAFDQFWGGGNGGIGCNESAHLYCFEQ